jgi:hypothetical protein
MAGAGTLARARAAGRGVVGNERRAAGGAAAARPPQRPGAHRHVALAAVTADKEREAVERRERSGLHLLQREGGREGGGAGREGVRGQPTAGPGPAGMARGASRNMALRACEARCAALGAARLLGPKPPLLLTAQPISRLNVVRTRRAFDLGEGTGGRLLAGRPNAQRPLAVLALATQNPPPCAASPERDRPTACHGQWAPTRGGLGPAAAPGALLAARGRSLRRGRAPRLQSEAAAGALPRQRGAGGRACGCQAGWVRPWGCVQLLRGGTSLGAGRQVGAAGAATAAQHPSLGVARPRRARNGARRQLLHPPAHAPRKASYAWCRKASCSPILAPHPGGGGVRRAAAAATPARVAHAAPR